jgi:hypothetical protein
MTELLKKEVKFHWNDKCEKAFRTLRKLLTTAPVLARQIIPSLLMSIVMLPELDLVVCLCKTTGSLLMLPEHSGIVNKIIQLMILS